ncbi:MAG TPA: hypothetical protein VGN18_10955 [Jatrophihabitans sp.]|jgi:hypothetical protein|uniref:DUF7455 domain-containing protein n=1 Tax=Jatrophihabitans sp. TaxID=1932789 RepID=UPI002E049EFC|nr:hypothetical protein [Jatrophihabitans sp.]
MGATVSSADAAVLGVSMMSVPLTVQDRCDRCSAQAYVRVMMSASGLEMLFCGHHFEQNSAALAGCSVVVTDDRQSLRLSAS